MIRDDGFTLLEATVLLTVLSLLTGLAVASAGDLLGESRRVQARDDVEEIGRAIADFYVDNGFFPRAFDVVDGRPGDDEIGTLASTAPLPDATDAANLWLQARADSLNAHLVTNDRGYPRLNPATRRGWHGPYVGRSVLEDPWGHAYLANVFYLDPRVAAEEIDGTPLGAVWVVSAGPNGILETPYFQPRDQARLWGDDIGFRLQ